jgi:cysteine desulfuration protein SufE
MSEYPPGLQTVVDFFESLGPDEKRENLIAYSDRAKSIGPREGETFTIEDVRKDEECTDTVGIFLRVDDAGTCDFKISLGPQVQTLTKALAAILVKGLKGATPQQILEVPSDFIPRIVGGELVRQRSQTSYYVLTRMKSVCKVWLNRQRAAAD